MGEYMDEYTKVKGMLSVGIEQLVAYIYSITFGEMDQDELQDAVERGTKLIENISELIVSIAQHDAIAYRLLANDGIEHKFYIKVEISGKDSLAWSIPA